MQLNNAFSCNYINLTRGSSYVIEKEYTRLLEDMETGEVIPIYNGDKVSITRAETIEYLKQTLEINKGKDFTMVISTAFRKLAKLKLTSDEYDVLVVMLSCLGWGAYSGYVVKKENRRPCGYMNGEDILKYTDFDKTRLSKAITKLDKKGIIKKIDPIEGSGNNFVVNPFIMTHDKRVPINIIKMFESTPFCDSEKLSHLNSRELQERIREAREKNEPL